MIGSRIPPLLLLFALGALVLIGRLAWIQVERHEVWAEEAARLVHAGRVLPYRRGRILDAHGELFAKDKGTFQLVLLYREFRRGHPLGQVAHARSLLEGRAVSLPEAQGSLRAWAVELVSMTTAELEAFADGESAWTPGLDAREAHLGKRAADMRFYLGRLLDLNAGQWNEVRKRGRRKERDTPFHVLAAAERSATSERSWTSDEVLEDLETRLARSIDQLARFSELLDLGEEREDPYADPLPLLVDTLEDSRRLVEDATAAKLFFEATGFAPGRLEATTLLGEIDLDWIMHLFAWDRARMEEWARTSRERWLASWRDQYALPHLHAQLLLEFTAEARPADVLNRLAAIYAPAGTVEGMLDEVAGEKACDWRELELAVFGGLDELFDAPFPPELRARRQAILPIQDREVRAKSLAAPADWGVIDAVVRIDTTAETSSALVGAGSPGERMQRHLARRRSRDADALFALFRAIIGEWELRFQAELVAILDAMRAAADPVDELSSDGRLVLREELRERAVERAGHLLKDYGMRPLPLKNRPPDYEVVYLLTRYREWFPGIDVREASEREYPVPAGDPGLLAEKLVGSVSAVNLFQLQEQRREAQTMRALMGQPRRTGEEEAELRRLAEGVLLPDEVRGVAGVEGFFDPELRGTNGYEERRGLQETFEGGGERQVRAPQDGEDLVLTLELDVQRAAARVLAEPPRVFEDDKFDAAWARNPVGAIVVITPDGDVIAAASEPTEHSSVPDEVSGQRANPIDRTLRKPGFQPPGSVFKPFVAAYALDRGGLDPARTNVCGPIARGGYGYEDVRCWHPSGHGEVNLERALVESCNAYFAWLGESYRDSDFEALADLFGFGEATGVRRLPPWDDDVGTRLGLREVQPALFLGSRPDGGMSPYQRRAAGNGLAVVEATPMQLARAFAGLATGTLPELRLAQSIGGRELPKSEGERVRISEASLERVREALRGVTNRPGGTGYRALNSDQLGIAIAAKTGSADITSRDDDQGTGHRVHKHTWVAGWAPAEEPELVFVIFVHDTMTTSSHGAVYLVRALFQQPEVRAWLEARGVELGDGVDGEGPR